MKSISKNTKKRTSFNTTIIKVLSEKFGVTEYFVRESVKRNKKSLTSDEIRKKYEELNKPTSDKIDEFIKQ